MTQQEFKNGLPFAVFGLAFDYLMYNAKTDLMNGYVGGKIKESSFLADDNVFRFTAFFTIFGYKQPIVIMFGHCELKK